MYKRRELYTKLYEFILFANDFKGIKHQSITNFLNGMKPTGERSSPDITIWLDWEAQHDEEIPKTEVYHKFKAFVSHWSNKYHMHALEEILYQMHPDDIDHKPEVYEKWKALFPDAEVLEY